MRNTDDVSSDEHCPDLTDVSSDASEGLDGNSVCDSDKCNPVLFNTIYENVSDIDINYDTSLLWYNNSVVTSDHDHYYVGTGERSAENECDFDTAHTSLI